MREEEWGEWRAMMLSEVGRIADRIEKVDDEVDCIKVEVGKLQLVAMASGTFAAIIATAVAGGFF